MTQPLLPWSSTLLYPPGPFSWSGTPTKVAPAVTFITPNQPQGLSAQNLNFLLNGRDAILAQVAIGQWAGAAANWNPPLTDVGAPTIPVATPYCACWDAYYEQWVVAGQAGAAGAFLTCSYDGGKSYFPLAGAVPTPTVRPIGFAVASNPVNGDLCLFRTDSTNCSVTLWASGTAGSPTDISQAALATANLGVLAYFNGAFWFVGSSGLGGATTWTGFSAMSLNGAGTWTNESGTLPTGWANTSIPSNPQLQYLAAQSPTTLAVAMCGQTPSTSTSRLMSMTTSSSWGDITPALLGGTAQEICAGSVTSRTMRYGGCSRRTLPATRTCIRRPTSRRGRSCRSSLDSGRVVSQRSARSSPCSCMTQRRPRAETESRTRPRSRRCRPGRRGAFAAYAEAISGESTELPGNPAGLLLSNAGAPLGVIAGGGGVLRGSEPRWHAVEPFDASFSPERAEAVPARARRHRRLQRRRSDREHRLVGPGHLPRPPRSQATLDPRPTRLWRTATTITRPGAVSGSFASTSPDPPRRARCAASLAAWTVRSSSSGSTTTSRLPSRTSLQVRFLGAASRHLPASTR